MQFTSTQLTIAIFGTILCLMGFVIRRQSPLDLLRPRFIVPAMIWLAAFTHVLIGYFYPPRAHKTIPFEDYMAVHGSAALLYICLALVMFYAGYSLPIGKKIGQKIGNVGRPIFIADNTLLFCGFSVALLLVSLTVIFAGPSVLRAEWGSFGVSSVILRSGGMGTAIFLLSLIAAACFGLSFPGFARRPMLSITVLFSIIILCLPLMAHFSRGAGLPMVIALFGYTIKMRKIKWVLFSVVLYVCALFAHAGLSGRGLYGHYAGALYFLTHAFTYSLYMPFDVMMVPLKAADSIFPLATTMAAIDSGTDIRLLSPMQWIVFQIPVPRIFGFHADWTPALTHFIGGQGSWHYTFGIFGDTFAHLGWFGALLFVYMGVAYRIVSAAAFDSRSAVYSLINPYYLWLTMSYFAMFMGIFNSFRAWQVTFYYSFYLLIIGVTLLRVVGARNDSSLQSSPSY